MMQCIQALATPPYPLLATLRLSLAGLLNFIHEAHSKLSAALDNSGFPFLSPRFLGFSAGPFSNGCICQARKRKLGSLMP